MESSPLPIGGISLLSCPQCQTDEDGGICPQCGADLDSCPDCRRTLRDGDGHSGRCSFVAPERIDRTARTVARLYRALHRNSATFANGHCPESIWSARQRLLWSLADRYGASDLLRFLRSHRVTVWDSEAVARRQLIAEECDRC